MRAHLLSPLIPSTVIVGESIVYLPKTAIFGDPFEGNYGSFAVEITETGLTPAATGVPTAVNAPVLEFMLNTETSLELTFAT